MRTRTARTRIEPGASVAAEVLTSVQGNVVSVPARDALVHLQFRRFAGCPVCDLHLSSFARRHKEVEASGIREVVVFHSDRETLLSFCAELPFAVIADPKKRLYELFGVGFGVRSLLDPRAWGAMLRGIYRSARLISRSGRPIPSLNPQGGRFGLPADFLIDRNGLILACKYGTHAYDQWSVDEVLAAAAAQLPMSAATAPKSSDREERTTEPQDLRNTAYLHPRA